MAWQDLALCAEVGGDMFFPETNQSTRAQKVVCESCPVRAECLQWALVNDERFGVWGGLSATERRRLSRQPDAAAAA